MSIPIRSTPSPPTTITSPSRRAMSRRYARGEGGRDQRGHRRPFRAPAMCATVRWGRFGEGGSEHVIASRSILSGGLALLALLAITACAPGSADDRPPNALGDDAITVGSFAFPESVLLAEIYSQALEAGG